MAGAHNPREIVSRATTDTATRLNLSPVNARLPAFACSADRRTSMDFFGVRICSIASVKAPLTSSLHVSTCKQPRRAQINFTKSWPGFFEARTVSPIFLKSEQMHENGDFGSMSVFAFKE